jgi:hypothetical protein
MNDHWNVIGCVGINQLRTTRKDGNVFSSTLLRDFKNTKNSYLSFSEFGWLYKMELSMFSK